MVKFSGCDASYLGKTRRNLETRLAEHRMAVQRGDVDVSTLAEHVGKEGHHVSWESMAVLKVSSCY